ncbi:NADH dehydrogenase [ubiquinone] 1 beta subcomplex subunit 10 [Apis mellifera caucasica]|uniref:NADH dehydrogenase [ubiquinone] 1 beta subcomplex subunit 10 n=1 Tax=Apis mellifera TaxID=7460 RepID=A0A7M7TG19_APIME|nr:NADH dehydrogenase [ubiquinone] 1 beta subcomplex subunit 10 [Apis mellifera]KAG6794762.1 NADH dehydrogenase [ubiquinone] 1 beta subcomplex subunit 10 [Apis mellifera caucasica]KAG9429630.1 NADH dehydrogenase [ubiquinone] 1 beta subcomplex subunit 10 [Apis mellifera carnica]|eukprot:XP_624801.1 NADH dehydrogenase [ubiquinone] 1 beta subcomplex subunit 10 [Apis mellifera]
MDPEQNFFFHFMKKLFYLLDTPVEYFREKIVIPNQKKYPCYHQNFRRVPTIDECYESDVICRWEAQKQFERDKMVDDEILSILRQRYEDCGWYYGNDKDKYCNDLYKTYQDASTAWFIKYGDIGVPLSVVDAFMKQKHRMIWERRHGPVGSGITNKRYDI